MRSTHARAALRVFLGVLFPLAVGASGCCGCPVGLCTRAITGIITSSPSPPVGMPSFGAGGGGGLGGEGGAFANEGPSLSPEPAPPSEGTAAIPGKPKSLSFKRDRREPIYGSVMPEGKGTRFVPHRAASVASLGDGTTFAVASPTGLWEHDTKTLAKRSRLVAEPVFDVASSPDGSRVAYALSNGRVRVVSYPALAMLASVTVDVPCRMRFSPDGQKLALASQSDRITLLEVATAHYEVHDTDEDVNDVAVMPDKPNEVAYASDDDEVAIADVKLGRKMFGSAGLVESWRQSNRPFFTMRDQTAVAYDAVTGTLLGGGDDNLFWRIDDVRATPSLRSPIELGGNIVEIACCVGKTAADRAAYVAVDDLRVRAVAMDGRLGPEFGPIAGSIGSYHIRIALLPTGDVLVAPQDMLYRWSVRANETLRSREYAWIFGAESALAEDTVYVVCDDKCAVHRAVHGARAADAKTTAIGELDADFAIKVLDFSGGGRVIAARKGQTLRLVYLPKGGSLEAPIDTPAVVELNTEVHFARKDDKTHGLIDNNGDIYEITELPRGATKVASAPGTEPTTRLEWDLAKRKWRIVRGAKETWAP